MIYGKENCCTGRQSQKGRQHDTLSDELIRGAEENGHSVTKFYLAQMNIHPCIGCNSCRRTEEHNCVFKDRDDFEQIIRAVIDADVLVIASPVYFYGMTAQLKTAIGRFYARENEVHDKAAYLVTTCIAPSEEYIEAITACFRGFISCFQNIREGVMIADFGTAQKGDVKSSPAMQEAYKTGKRI